MMMDWEEEERIRQEKRERRRRLHEKLADTSRQSSEKQGNAPGADREDARSHGNHRQEKRNINHSEPRLEQEKVTNQGPSSQNHSAKTSKKASKKVSKKEGIKWRLPKLKSKKVGKANGQSKQAVQQNNQGQIAYDDQLITDSQTMSPAKKVQKKTSKNWKKMGLLLLPFIIVLFVAGYYASPLNHVASIRVDGIEEADSVKLYPLKEGMSITDLNHSKADVEQAIVNQNPSIKSATIQVADWNQVAVNVSAYRQLGYIQIADFFYPMLENNEIIDQPLPSLEKELPLFEGYDISNEDQRAKLTDTVKAFSSLSDDIIQKISLITYTGDESNDDRIALQMTDGNVVRGFISTIGDRMSYYNGIASQLEGQTGLIDMEVAIYFTELNDGNNPYASAEDKKAYDESIAAESTAAESSEASSLEAVSGESASGESSSEEDETSSSQSTGDSSQIENASEPSENAASSSVEE